VVGKRGQKRIISNDLKLVLEKNMDTVKVKAESTMKSWGSLNQLT